MAEFEVEAFVAELERLGVRLTALRLADGSLKVYRWRMQGAREHAQEVDRLWNSQIGEDRTRNDLLAEHILRVDEKKYADGGSYTASKPPS